MKEQTEWQGLPYYPISQFYRRYFGHPVRKISITVAQTCPNREGLKGMQTCNFCDVWGSAAYPGLQKQTVSEQINKVREVLQAKFNVDKYLVYFQAYTTTFAKTAQLRQQFEEAFTFDDVVGVVVGTRPDCLSDAVLELWQEYAEKKFVAVELGVQSFSNEQLLWMRRGHTREQSLQAVARIRRQAPSVNLGIHLIFGLPGEKDADVIEAAQICNDLPIDNVKLHNLHVLKGTPLAEDLAQGRFTPTEKEVYFHRCELFLQHLRKDLAVHRLAALANDPEELIAPLWTGYKMQTYQEFLDHMNVHKSYQGQLLVT